jgi:large subunit ribosomal protein L9
MKVILLEDVHGVGAAGAVAEVANGYARNFLIPRKLALAATAGAMKDLERQRETIRRRQVSQAATAQSMAEKIAATSLTIKARIGEEGRLYGTVTNVQIAEELARKGITVDRHDITIPHPIRMVGSHEVSIHLHKDVDATLRIEVEPEGEA